MPIREPQILFVKLLSLLHYLSYDPPILTDLIYMIMIITDNVGQSSGGNTVGFGTLDIITGQSDIGHCIGWAW